MEAMSDIFTLLGIKPAVMVAGLAGGVLRALSRQRFKIREMVAAPICGALAAAYLTDPAAYYAHTLIPLPPDESATYAMAFVIGVGAMWISDIVFDQIVRRFKPDDT
jgi:hypothetical protein